MNCRQAEAMRRTRQCCSSAEVYTLLCVVLCCPGLTGSQQTTCSATIGSANRTPFSRSRASGFFINTLDKAPCNGTINMWSYCSTAPPVELERGDSREATFAVFRFNSSTEEFVRVSPPIMVSEENTDEEPMEFSCNMLDTGFAVEVLSGDVIGVCMYDTSQQEELRIVSEEADNSSILLESTNIDCEQLNERVPDMVNSADLATRHSMALFLYAEIECDDNVTHTSLCGATEQRPTHSTTKFDDQTNFTGLSIDEGTAMDESGKRLAMIIGIVFIVLIVLILIITVVIIVGMCAHVKRTHDLKRGTEGTREVRLSTFKSTRDRLTTSHRSDTSLTYNATYFTTPYHRASQAVNDNNYQDIETVDTVVNGTYAPFSRNLEIVKQDALQTPTDTSNRSSDSGTCLQRADEGISSVEAIDSENGHTTMMCSHKLETEEEKPKGRVTNTLVSHGDSMSYNAAYFVTPCHGRLFSESNPVITVVNRGYVPHSAKEEEPLESTTHTTSSNNNVYAYVGVTRATIDDAEDKPERQYDQPFLY